MKQRVGRVSWLRPSRWIPACSLVFVLVTGCSGTDDKPAVPDAPLPGALSYVRSDAGAVFIVDTDTERAVSALAGRRLERSGRRALEGAIAAELEQRGIDFDEVIRPQLGNPLVVAITHDAERIGAIRVRGPGSLRRAVESRLNAGGARRLEDKEGALVWREGGGRDGAQTYAALTGRELVVAQSEKALAEALVAARDTDNLAASRSFRALVSRLPATALVRGLGDAQRLLSAADPLRAADARRVPWIRALGGFTLLAEVGRRQIGVEFELTTKRVPLTARDVPLATGPASPRIHDPDAPAAAAVREPRRLVRFLENTLRATDPSRFERYEAGRDSLRSFLGVDLQADLLDRIQSLSVAARSAAALSFQAKLERGAGAGFARDLDRALPFVEGVIGDTLAGTEIEARGVAESRVWLVRNRGVTIARYAVNGDTLVGAVGLSELPRPARGIRIGGVTGSLVLKGDIDRIGGLVGLVLEVPRRTFGIVSSLGELTLGLRTSTDEMSGEGHITVGARRR